MELRGLPPPLHHHFVCVEKFTVLTCVGLIAKHKILERALLLELGPKWRWVSGAETGDRDWRLEIAAGGGRGQMGDWRSEIGDVRCE